MIVLWRIGVDTAFYTADDLSGKGAEKTGGRWNRPGLPVAYAASSIALAALETVVHLHLENQDYVPQPFLLFPYVQRFLLYFLHPALQLLHLL